MTRLGFVLLLAACVTGCGGRELRAVRCAWPSERAAPVDANTLDGFRHLHEDARAAEALAVRYADSATGLSQPGEHRRLTETCEATLVNSIADVHHVTPEQVRVALRRQNDTPF